MQGRVSSLSAGRTATWLAVNAGRLRDDSKTTPQCFLGNITAERDGYDRIAEVVFESFLGTCFETENIR